MIETTCEHCGNKKTFAEDKLGKKFKCPNCGNIVLIDKLKVEQKEGSVSKQDFVNDLVDTSFSESHSLKDFVLNHKVDVLSAVAIGLVAYNAISAHYPEFYNSIWQLGIFGVMPLLVFKYIKFDRAFKVLISLPLVYISFLLLSYLRQFNNNLVDCNSETQINIFKLFIYTTLFSAFALDVLEKRKPELIYNFKNKLRLFFLPGLGFFVWFIPFITLFIFYNVTRHQVTDIEKQKFIEANNILAGNWYELSSDSTDTQVQILHFDELQIKKTDIKGIISYEIIGKEETSSGIYDYDFQGAITYRDTLKFPIKLQSKPKEGRQQDVMLEIASISGGQMVLNKNWTNNSKTQLEGFKDKSKFIDVLTSKITKNLPMGKSALIGRYIREEELIDGIHFIEITKTDSGVLEFKSGINKSNASTYDKVVRTEYQIKPSVVFNSTSGLNESVSDIKCIYYLSVKDNSTADVLNGGKIIIPNNGTAIYYDSTGNKFIKADANAVSNAQISDEKAPLSKIQQSKMASNAGANDFIKKGVILMVISEKAYFYDKPNESYIKKSYLVTNERITVLEVQDNFVYVDFKNPQGRVTKGWLNVKDLSDLSGKYVF